MYLCRLVGLRVEGKKKTDARCVQEVEAPVAKIIYRFKTAEGQVGSRKVYDGDVVAAV